MNKTLYTIEELKDPETLLVKLRDEAQGAVIEAFVNVVYKALIKQAAKDAWQLTQYHHVSLNHEKDLETLFGGKVSTEEEQQVISEEVEWFRNAYTVLMEAYQTIRSPELPGLAEFIKSLLPKENKDNS